MRGRIVRRYSSCFKRQVVEDLENGRFESLEAARHHYGIGGHRTIQLWLRQYGKNHLQAKVVRVEKPDEADRIREIPRQLSAGVAYSSCCQSLQHLRPLGGSSS